MNDETAAGSTPRLRRVLGLWDLIFYGIVLIQPIAAVGLFGIATQLSRGRLDRAFLFHPLLQSVNLPIQLRPHGHFLRGSDL